jgi:hypothetical protein
VPPASRERCDVIRVAVVDDEALTRAALRLILESAGAIEVVTEVEGRDAINQVRAAAPDLVLHAVMPDVDGLTVITCRPGARFPSGRGHAHRLRRCSTVSVTPYAAASPDSLSKTPIRTG